LQIGQQFDELQQVTISYGDCANSYLLTEYGFCITDNHFDFLRVDGVTIDDFSVESVSPDFEARLNSLNLKKVLRADLKANSVHRDVLKLLRAAHPSENEIEVI
jgi:hypothetical protein